MYKSFEITPVSRKARVEIIPLIDVIFFLLATFVLFTLSLNKIASLQAVFPDSRPKTEISDDNTLYLQALGPDLYSWKEGRFSGSEQITLPLLKSRLVDYRERVKAPRVSLSGADGVRLGLVIQLLDEVRSAQIKEVCLETSP